MQKSYLNKQIATHRDYLEQHLTNNQWFAGSDFSAADIQMSFPIVALQERIGGKYPKMKAYAERIQKRPAFQKAKAKSAF